MCFSLLAVALLSVPVEAEADVVLPKKGMRYWTSGMSLNPGFLYDSRTDEIDDVSSLAPAASGTGQIGVTQIISRKFFMAAEVELGLQWLDEHTAARAGETASSTNFAWEIGLLGHWLPFEEEAGWSAGAGLHLFRAHLEDAPLQVLGADLRLGRYFWGPDEQYVQVYVGYSAPVIQGLDRPEEFGAGSDWSERNWSFHRFSLGFQYGF